MLRRAWTLAILACSGPPSAPPTDGGTTLLAACEQTEPAPVALDPVLSTLEGTIAPANARQVADPRIDPSTYDGEQSYVGLGYADFARGDGLPARIRAELMPQAPPGPRRSLAYLALLSDFQLADDESPARWARTDSPDPMTTSAMRPQEAYLPIAVSAMNRTLTRIAAASRPFDIGIVTGDCADMAQLNELRWVIELMDGARVEVDSGEDDDPLPGPNNDPKDPFQAVPFPGPWLYVPGNHDLELVGLFAPNDAEIQMALGTDPMVGTRDYRRFWAPVTTDPVPADPGRIPVSRTRIVEELLAGPSLPGPHGHGFVDGQDVTLGASYVYDAIPNLLRLIVIDTNDATGGAEGMVLRAQMDGFIVPAIQRAEADGMLAMLVSHHSTAAIDRFEGQLGGEVADALDGAEIEQTIASHPNVIAWLVGHTHRNRIRAVAAVTGGAGPGYWEIMTSALADWPSQGRIVELVDDGNGQLSIYATTVDYDTDTCMERRYRRLALVDFVSGWSQDSREDPGDSNARLIIPVPFGARAAVAAASAADRIESETVLAGR